MAYSDYIHLFALEEQYFWKVVTSEQKNVIQAVKKIKINHEAKKKKGIITPQFHLSEIIHTVELKMWASC